MATKTNMLSQNNLLFSNIMLYVPSLSLFKFDVRKGEGGGGSLITDGVQKGPKYADVMLEQPLIPTHNFPKF